MATPPNQNLPNSPQPTSQTQVAKNRFPLCHIARASGTDSRKFPQRIKKASEAGQEPAEATI